VTPITPRHSFTYASARVNVYHAGKGDGLPRHEHAYSHATVCMAGSIVIRKEGIEHVMTPESQPVSLKPNEWHEIEALEDGTVFQNVFAAPK
jgi:quercetin dioxygenase-like cupin family protein